MRGFKVQLFAGLLFLLTDLATNIHAATLQTVGGQLVGATGVEVGTGIFFNVSFVEGSCDVIFTECGGTLASFAFSDEASATIASQALLAQVFIDDVAGMFDARPNLTLGCEDSFGCGARTPYAVPLNLEMMVALNSAAGLGPDGVSQSLFISPSSDTTFNRGSVYAVWSSSPVPTPSTTLLMGTGLLGLIGYRKWSTNKR